MSHSQSAAAPARSLLVPTEKSILNAMRELAQTKPRYNRATTRFYVDYKGKRYPAKLTLSLATGVATDRFSGGSQTNRLLEAHGFTIVDARPTQPPDPRLNAPVPRAKTLTDRLFRSHWAQLPLWKDFGGWDFPGSEYPGVYLIAYSDRDLTGRKVSANDVYYVGMSHAGLRKRLSQFVRGVQDGGHHSGAQHHYQLHGPYQVPNSEGRQFFFATISLPCIYRKSRRFPRDLQKLGIVSQLEYYAIAHCKEVGGREPELNRQ